MLTQNFLIGIVFYSLLYYLPIYYQTVRQMSLLDSAALIVPLVIAQAIASALSGQYISHFGRYWEVILTGYVCWVIGTSLHCIFSRDIPAVGIVFVLIVEGFGVGLVFQPTLVAAQAHSAKKDRAVVISARNFIRALGGSAGLAVASAIFANSLTSNIPTGIPAETAQEMRDLIIQLPDMSGLTETQQSMVLDAYMVASKSVFYLWAGAMACCLLLMVFIKDKGLKRETEPPAADVQDRETAGIQPPTQVTVVQ